MCHSRQLLQERGLSCWTEQLVNCIEIYDAFFLNQEWRGTAVFTLGWAQHCFFFAFRIGLLGQCKSSLKRLLLKTYYGLPLSAFNLRHNLHFPPLNVYKCQKPPPPPKLRISCKQNWREGGRKETSLQSTSKPLIQPKKGPQQCILSLPCRKTIPPFPGQVINMAFASYFCSLPGEGGGRTALMHTLCTKTTAGHIFCWGCTFPGNFFFS